MRYLFSLLLLFFLVSCANWQTRSSDQVIAERALIQRKTALLERENQILRDENLELTRQIEHAKAEVEKQKASFLAQEDKQAAEMKTLETQITNLTEKIKILESDSVGKIRRLTQLNEQLTQKANETQKKLQDELSDAQQKAAKEREKLTKEAAEKQFAQEKELELLRRELSELKNKPQTP